MVLQGKGFFIWQIQRSEQGDVNAIAARAQEAGLTHVLIKIANGTNDYNLDSENGTDLVPALVHALRVRKISPMGWHYVYGYDPTAEADRAIRRVQQLGLDAYIIDAESEYKQPGKSAAARAFMNRLRTGLPDTPIGLSSYRYPSFHPQLPWQAFLEKCDFNMPQVYWMGSHNPADQLIRCVREFQGINPVRPLIPTGAAFKEAGWMPSAADVTAFLEAAQNLNLTAANFYEWGNARTYLPAVWDAIKDYSWPVTPGQKDIVEQYFDALNSHDPSKLTGLYGAKAVHVMPARTIQGETAIRSWYNTLFTQMLPNATFELTSFTGTGSSRFFNWTANSPAVHVRNGSDTFGLVNGKIAYHYSYFSIG